MLDFMTVSTRCPKKGIVEIYPKFLMKKSSDLMIRGQDFYAIWVEERGLWSTDENDVITLVDRELDVFAEKYIAKHKSEDSEITILYMWDAGSGTIDRWHKYCQKQLRDNFNTLDEKLIFSNAEVNKKDYASKRLTYPLEPGECPAYEKLISTLYSPEERRKIEWAIGAIITGDSTKIQKFMVFYGAAGTGKSTILNIIQQLFDGYYAVFDAKALGSSNNQFALEAFKENPLVAIQHDGDLSKIEDNTRLNSLVSHEMMTINEKFKTAYASRFKSFLLMGTNKPVKITDAKSGLLRRLIDVSPTGNKIPIREYKSITKQVAFELGAIACHCRDIYLEDPGRYDDYIPMTMMGASNDFYNYMMDSYHVFKKEDGVTLKAAWEMYKTYCEEAKVPYPFAQRNFKEELKNYFWNFSERFSSEDGQKLRSYYSGFRTDKFEEDKDEYEEKSEVKNDPDKKDRGILHVFETGLDSNLDTECSDCPAQYANAHETPSRKWENVKTKLSDLDTSRLHYVKVPENHIVIDFDIKDSTGKKSPERNLEEASKWPATYAELSKGGAGIHLHYIYAGDVTKLSRIYDDDIEVKVFTGNSSLRRKLTKCNDIPIATISSGLPLKGDDKLINWDGIKNEKMLRTMIKRNLNKEYHPATKPSIDYIHKLLEDAYNGGLNYDVSDLKNGVIEFASHSTNRADYCLQLVTQMKFKSDEPSINTDDGESPIVFYDVEVFSNLFVVCWKLAGEGNPIVRMINPGSKEIEDLLKYRLIGFNCRRYDNHILYARLLGYDNERLYELSQKIINAAKGERNTAFFSEAYNLSYTDIFDYAAKKQSLKKWEIELGIHHQELGIPWDKPVDEKLWDKVAEYCCNDVVATEAVFNHTQGDFTARKILADLAGMTVNDTTNTLTTRIIFGKERNPSLVYTDLATGEQFGTTESRTSSFINAFPGYEFKNGKNLYRETDVGMGGYVYSNPGMYTNVALIDVASMHPNSIISMNCFGEYTKNFEDLLKARIAIKHGDFESAKKMLGGRLSPYLNDESKATDLSQALKISCNSCYGLTAANFNNVMRDTRNKNNIVALKGALFMRTLQDEVINRGFKIVAIRTDSIKIADATNAIINFCMGFAQKYGYSFEHEATYDRICQINDADYIAKYATIDKCNALYGRTYVEKEKDILKDNKKHGGEWTATGKQFQIPYVFKTLFAKEPIELEDLCETKEVKTALYLDMNESLPEGEHSYQFIGKVGLFCPIQPDCGGGLLVREGKDKEGNIKYDAATGTKGYRWLEAEMVKTLGKKEDIDKAYYNKLVDDAVDAISKYGDFEMFVSDDAPVAPWTAPEVPDVPWFAACGKPSCAGCPELTHERGLYSCRMAHDVSDLNKLEDESYQFDVR